MSILLINMSKVISLKEQKNILVYLYASWLIQYWLIVCDRAHQLIRLIPHFRALCSSTDIHWLKCVTMFHCSVLDSPHSHQPHHIGWSVGFFTQSFANPYLVILPPAPMHLMLKKSRNGDTLGPVELIVWSEKGNQDDCVALSSEHSPKTPAYASEQ